MAIYDVAPVAAAVALDTQGRFTQVAHIPGQDRIIASWSSTATTRLLQVFSVHPVTGVIAAIGTPLDIQVNSMVLVQQGFAPIVMIDSGNFAVFWADGVISSMRLYTVDVNGDIATNGASVEYINLSSPYSSAVLWDSTHILLAYKHTTTSGRAVIVSANTGTGTIAVVGTAVEFEATAMTFTSLAKTTADTAVVAFGGADADGWCRGLSVNPSTFAVTNLTSAFEFKDAILLRGVCVGLIEVSGSNVRFAIEYRNQDAVTSFIRSFTLDLNASTIAAYGAELTLAVGEVVNEQCLFALVNGYVLIAFHGRNTGSNAGKVSTLKFDSGTGDFTVLSTFDNYGSEVYEAGLAVMGNGRYVYSYFGGPDGDKPYARTFGVEVPPDNFLMVL